MKGLSASLAAFTMTALLTSSARADGAMDVSKLKLVVHQPMAKKRPERKPTPPPPPLTAANLKMIKATAHLMDVDTFKPVTLTPIAPVSGPSALTYTYIDFGELAAPPGQIVIKMVTEQDFAKLGAWYNPSAGVYISPASPDLTYVFDCSVGVDGVTPSPDYPDYIVFMANGEPTVATGGHVVFALRGDKYQRADFVLSVVLKKNPVLTSARWNFHGCHVSAGK